jgi:hypothetical protein
MSEVGTYRTCRAKLTMSVGSRRDRHAHFERGFDRQRPAFPLGDIMRSKGLAPFPLALFGFISDARCAPVSGLEGAVVKYVLDHVVNSPTVSRVQSAGCLAGLFTFCSGINCIQAKELTDTAHGNK